MVRYVDITQAGKSKLIQQETIHKGTSQNSLEVERFFTIYQSHPYNDIHRCQNRGTA